MDDKKEMFKVISKKVNNSISTALSTISLSLGCAFVSSYTHSEFFEKVKLDKFVLFNFFAYILSNPYVYIIVGAVILFLSEYGNHLKKNDIINENNDFKEKDITSTKKIEDLRIENEGLKSAINSEQELSQVLRVKICDVHVKQITTWLKGVFKQMELTPEERVSIYFVVNKEFHILDRYSSNPNYKEIHKQRFSLNQGVISKTWQKGSHHELGSPEFSVNNDGYQRYMMQNYGFSENEITSLNMKSCRLLGVAINDADENIGVILFESTSGDSLSLAYAQKILEYCKNYQSHLCGFVKDSIIYNEELEKNKAILNSNTDREVLDALGGENEK